MRGSAWCTITALGFLGYTVLLLFVLTGLLIICKQHVKSIGWLARPWTGMVVQAACATTVSLLICVLSMAPCAAPDQQFESLQCIDTTITLAIVSSPLCTFQAARPAPAPIPLAQASFMSRAKRAA